MVGFSILLLTFVILFLRTAFYSRPCDGPSEELEAVAAQRC